MKEQKDTMFFIKLNTRSHPNDNHEIVFTLPQFQKFPTARCLRFKQKSLLVGCLLRKNFASANLAEEAKR